MKIEFDHPTRGKHYRQANEEYPAVRRREIEHMLACWILGQAKQSWISDAGMACLRGPFRNE